MTTSASHSRAELPTHPRALARVIERLATTQHPIDRAALEGQQAVMLARLGRHAEALAITQGLQARFERQPDPRVSVWVALAEGLSAYYRDLDLAGRDRIRRAHALASAARLRSLQALTAAWLAQLDYVRHDLPSMARHLADALAGALDDDHAALARACLVMAQAWHWAGRVDTAAAWYARCRTHAQADGDDATLAALMHNAAWLRAMQAREASFGHGPAPLVSSADRERAQAVAMAGSAASLDRLIDNQGLADSLPLLQAMLAVDRGESAAALRQLNQAEAATASASAWSGRWQALALADQAWCHSQLADLSAARRAADLAASAMDQQPDVDDRALTHARLAQVYQALNQAATAEHHAKLADLDLAELAIARRAMVEALAPLQRSHGPG